MLVLFDNGTPRTLARYLIDRHTVTEVRARGWEELENGELLTVAEAAGFEVLVTTDAISGTSRTLPHAKWRFSFWAKADGASLSRTLRRLLPQSTPQPRAAMPK